MRKQKSDLATVLHGIPVRQGLHDLVLLGFQNAIRLVTKRGEVRQEVMISASLDGCL